MSFPRFPLFGNNLSLVWRGLPERGHPARGEANAFERDGASQRGRYRLNHSYSTENVSWRRRPVLRRSGGRPPRRERSGILFRKNLYSRNEPAYFNL